MPRYTVPLAAAALTLAACSDAPLDPSARLTPDAAPSAMLGSGGDPRPTDVTVTLQLHDQSRPPEPGVEGTIVKFTSNTGESRTVTDNGAGDGDARVGYYKVTMDKAAWYMATVVAMPSDFSSDKITKTASAFVTPTLVSMGTLEMVKKPWIDIWLFYNDVLAPGQTIRITGPNGFSKTFVDGGANDLHSAGAQAPSDGKFEFMWLPTIGVYTVCTLTTPKLYWDTGCLTIDVSGYGSGYPRRMDYKPLLVLPQF